MDEKRLHLLYSDPLRLGSKTDKRIPPIICESELDVFKLWGHGVPAVCFTGKPSDAIRLYSRTTKAWSRKRPRWYRRQAARALRIGSVHG